MDMAEKTNEKKIYEHHISPEAREHFRATRQEMHKSLEGILPPEFKDHLRKAHREMLLGWRSMIDTVLQRMENPEKKT
jgi:hypothetical protein